MENSKLRILVKGWINIPHSYAVVNCFQLAELIKNFGDKLDIYVEEAKYYREDWKPLPLVYNDENNNIINNLKKWSGELVDIVYNITYPYDITPVIIDNKIIPKCVFYTSEFAWINNGYFSHNSLEISNEEQLLKILKDESLYFTSPSVWSANGLKQLGINDSKNRIITHGVDTSLFYKHNNNKKRNAIRKFYKVKETDILLINIGAMTQNKGITLILEALHDLVNIQNKKHYKLLLKGNKLYQTKQFLEIYFERFQSTGVMTKDQMNNLLENNIIFTTQTMSYEKINEHFNAADLYISPYLAEGFNLTVLESLSTGLPVLVPRTGSTKEYVEDIYNNGGKEYINYVDSKIGRMNNANMYQNIVEVKDIINVLNNIKHRSDTFDSEDTNTNYNKVHTFIQNNYSWRKVSELLYDYLKYIVSLQNKK